ncbi:7266_t:CDS:2, partial [Entrophospora sp. SA101]
YRLGQPATNKARMCGFGDKDRRSIDLPVKLFVANIDGCTAPERELIPSFPLSGLMMIVVFVVAADWSTNFGIGFKMVFGDDNADEDDATNEVDSLTFPWHYFHVQHYWIFYNEFELTQQTSFKPDGKLEDRTEERRLVINPSTIPAQSSNGPSLTV